MTNRRHSFLALVAVLVACSSGGSDSVDAGVADSGTIRDGGVATDGGIEEEDHTIGFDAGRTLSVLVAPDGTSYVRVSRDATRTSDTPTIPSDWQLREQAIAEPLTIELPNPTDNIRGDNEDSWQGPVPGL